MLQTQEPWAFTHVFKVLIPNELNGSLLTKTLPLRPNMTTKEISRIIALKLRITNPQDFALYQLVEGEGKLNSFVSKRLRRIMKISVQTSSLENISKSLLMETYLVC